jgi:hypothetical protein
LLVNNDVIQRLREQLVAGGVPTIEQTQELLSRLQIAETMLATLYPSLGYDTTERDIYVSIARYRAEVLDDLLRCLPQTKEPIPQYAPDGIGMNHHSLWRYNLREFFELNDHGWRAIVSSDSEDHIWIAYIERSGVRFYAPKTFVLLQDALRWCTEEINRQVPEAIE